jgi:hypothetical protein
MYKDILIKILEAIEYTDDKEAFVNDFTQMVESQSVVDLISGLPDDKKELIKSDLSTASTPEHANETMKKYFTEEQTNQAINKSVQMAISAWMQAIGTTLSDVQKEKIVALGQELQKN